LDDLSDKTVGIVGTGSSGIQIISTIADKVKQLVVFQRTPPYVMPKLQFEYPEWVKWAFEKVPGVRWFHRAMIFFLQELIFFVMRPNTFGSIIGTRTCEFVRKVMIKSDHLRNKLTPKYAIGNKRAVISSGFYQALNKRNVELVTESISKVVNKSIITRDGKEFPLDVCKSVQTIMIIMCSALYDVLS